MKNVSDAATPRPLAVFDFDGTMIQGDSIVSFVRQAVRKGHMPLRMLPGVAFAAWQGLRGRLSPEEGKSRSLAFLAKLDEETLQAFCCSFCRDCLMPRIYPKALQRLQHHLKQGDAVVLLSASPDIYLQYMGPLLGVDAVLATPTDARGVVRNNNRGQQKVRRLKDWADSQPYPIRWASSWSYGDSAHDLPVMRLCGHPVMVNPKPAMLQAAQGLPVEHWRQ